jgi:hypothetical protein
VDIGKDQQLHSEIDTKDEGDRISLKRVLCVLARRVSVLSLFAGLILAAGSGKAQSLGYAFIGATAGDLSGAFRYGVGGEWATAPHIRLGAEIGGIEKNSSGLLASANITGHIPGRGAFDPFVTGGISVAHWSSSTGAYGNVGGGLNYWWNSHLAFRGEFRGYLGGGDLPGFGEFRFGVTFR